RRRHTRFSRDWSSDVCSSDLKGKPRRTQSSLPRRRLHSRRRLQYGAAGALDGCTRRCRSGTRLAACPGGRKVMDWQRERDRMVERDIAARGVTDPNVLNAMRTVPRELFLPPELSREAYSDRALPIAEGQTISQPYVVALMTEAAEVKPGDRVLEVGTGSGYAAAVLSRIADEVYTVERHPLLAGQ